MILKKSDKTSIEKTVATLKAGGIVIIPTDTVYGFSGIVDLAQPAGSTGGTQSFKTDSKIRAIKGRAESKPLIQLIAKPEDIRLYTDDEIPVELLSKWPGALTIIVHIKENSPLAATAIPATRTVAGPRHPRRHKLRVRQRSRPHHRRRRQKRSPAFNTRNHRKWPGTGYQTGQRRDIISYAILVSYFSY